ncbi:MAG: ABC transporter ATP-binding protein [Lewinella sp.]|nr:ABC transporter ATP-binding protein [Lewinella sp.]
MDNSVQIRGLSKSYREGAVRALQQIELEVAAGELFGLIGPDGAGKTTLFRLLTTLLLPDEGTATVAGYDIVDDLWDIRRHVGYMPGRFSLYQDLSVEENLQFFATVFNTTIEENYHLIKEIYVQLEPFKKRPAGKLSGGMKQKLALCCALVHEPKVLFLDEPTTGVDPVSRKEFWDMLGRLRERGITILVSTPYMDEASRCDRIALIQDGRILEVDKLEAIIAKHEQALWAVTGQDMYGLLMDIRSYPGTASCFAFGDTHHLSLRQPEQGVDELERYLRERGHPAITIEPIRPNIEDTFIRLMQEAEQ